MNAVLWIFLAFAAAILLFSTIQDELPDELGFLKNKGTVMTGAARQDGRAGEPARVTQYQGWTIRTTSSAVEFVRPLSASIVVNGTPYDAPEFGLLCDNGRLDMRLDTRTNTTGTKTTPVTVTGLGAQQWDKSASKNIFPKDARTLLRHLQSTNAVQFRISYVELGVQTVSLDTSALPALVQTLPAPCQP